MISKLIVGPFQLKIFYDSMITETDAADQIHLDSQPTEVP